MKMKYKIREIDPVAATHDIVAKSASILDAQLFVDALKNKYPTLKFEILDKRTGEVI